MTETKTEVLTENLTWSSLRDGDWATAKYTRLGTNQRGTGEARAQVWESRDGELYWLEESGFRGQTWSMYHGFELVKVEREVAVAPRPEQGTFGWGTFEGQRWHGFVSDQGDFLFWNAERELVQEEPVHLVQDFEPDPASVGPVSDGVISWNGEFWQRQDDVKKLRERDFEDYKKALELPTVDEIQAKIYSPRGGSWSAHDGAVRVLEFLKKRQPQKDVA